MADDQSKGIGKHPPGHGCGFCRRIREQRKSAAEKEARGEKVRRNLSVRARRFVQDFSDPSGPSFRNATGAAISAGYSPDSAEAIGANLLRDERVQKSILAAFERAGITEAKISEVLFEALGAETVWRHVSKKGMIVERRDPDHYTRLKAIDPIMRARGDFPKEEPLVQAALILRVPDQPLSVEEWNERERQERLAKSNEPTD